jgi:hypothetical protein
VAEKLADDGVSRLSDLLRTLNVFEGGRAFGRAVVRSIPCRVAPRRARLRFTRGPEGNEGVPQRVLVHGLMWDIPSIEPLAHLPPDTLFSGTNDSHWFSLPAMWM